MSLKTLIGDNVRAFLKLAFPSKVDRFLSQVKADNAAFDARYGAETADDIRGNNYDAKRGQEVAETTGLYQCVHEGALRAIIEALAPAPEEFEFIDIGSGKGKALMVAATYPFRRVRGIEILPALHAAAEENLRSFKSAGHVQCADVSSVCGDALQIADLSGDVLVLLFNALPPDPMRAFVERLGQELGSARVTLAYLTPDAREALDESSAFRCLLETDRLLVYGSAGVTISDTASEGLRRRFNSWQA